MLEPCDDIDIIECQDGDHCPCYYIGYECCDCGQVQIDVELED